MLYPKPKPEGHPPVMPFNPIALKTAKTLWSFGHFECNRVESITTLTLHPATRLMTVFHIISGEVLVDGCVAEVPA